jgi:PKD repeat protein
LGLALNGEGKFTFDGQAFAHDRVDTTDTIRMVAPTNPGTHTVAYTVSGPGGSVVCEAKVDIFAQQTISPISPVITLTAMRWCDTEHDGFRPDRLVMGMVQQVRCHPGGTLLNWAGGGAAGWGLSRISHLQPHARPAPPPLVVGKTPPSGGVATGRVP